MKILLANLPWQKDGKWGVRAGSRWPHIKDEIEDNYLPFPFFLAYATSLLQKHGISATLIDAIAEQIREDKFIEKISRMDFDLLVVETSTPSFLDDLNILKKMSSLGTRIVLCGPHIEIYQPDFLKERIFIEFVLYGEYEFTLLELVKNLKENKDLSNIKGLIWRDKNEVIKNPSCEPFDINLLPWPSREGLPMKKYWDLPGNIPYPSVQMLASRGCPFSCSFCLWPQVFYQGNHYRTRDIKDVVDEMEYLIRNKKFKSIYFDDDTFNIGKERMLRFCREIKERNLQNTPWAIMARPDLMDEEILEEMKSAGLFAVKYGVESGVNEIQEVSGKYLNLEKTVKIVRTTKELDIKVHLTFMFGLLGETKESIRNTLDFALGLNPSSLQFSIATPFPGTKYFEELDSKGLLISKRWSDYDGNSRSVLRTEKLSAEELESAQKQAYFYWTEHCKRRERYRYLTLIYKLILSLKTFGPRYTLKKIHRYLERTTKYYKLSQLPEKIRSIYGDILRLLGVLDGSYAYIGPSLVQIDLTNDCNNNCIGCWCNSPLLQDAQMDSITRKQKLSLEVLKNLIDDLHKMHTKEIFLAGGGEPFMHPDLLDIVRYIKSKKMTCYINTNFTLINESILKELVNFGLGHITVSLWAGTPQVYAATHPNKDENTFLKIKEMLQLTSHIKKENKKNKPLVKIYNVISNINYLDIEKMIDSALEVEAEEIEFTVIDVIPGKTDILLLSRQQRDTVLEEFNRLRDKIDLLQNTNRLIFIQLDLFLKRLSNEGALSGEYDRELLQGVPCYIGWLFSRVSANGDVNVCLKSHKIPAGNINEKKFPEIWNSPKQIMFRKKLSKLDKADNIFSMIGNNPKARIGCYITCDNIRLNSHIYQKISKPSFTEKLFLTLIANLLKIKRYLSS